MWVAVCDLFRVGQRDLGEQVVGKRLAQGPRMALQAEHFLELAADLHRGVQSAAGLLVNNGDVAGTPAA
jgi:hypothetical protein